MDLANLENNFLKVIRLYDCDTLKELERKYLDEILATGYSTADLIARIFRIIYVYEIRIIEVWNSVDLYYFDNHYIALWKPE